MTETLNKKQQGAVFGIYIVIVAVYFVIPDMGYIVPSLSAIAEVYGVDAGVASYLSTIVSLTQIFAALVSGIIVGKYVKHKTMLMISTGGMAVFGMIPALFTPDVPFMILMIDRAVFGFFLGFLQPIIFAYIAQVFVDENKRAYGYGIGNIAFNVGAVLATSLGGICVGIGWNTAFWLYAIGIVVLALVAIFYKEPEHVSAAKQEKGGKARITPLAWFFMAVFVIVMTLDYPFMTGFVSVAVEHGITDAVIGGQLMSVFTAVGIVASALFGLMFKLMRVNVLPLMSVLAAIGLAVIFAGSNVFVSLPICVIGIVILGYGHSAITVAIPQCVSIVCTPAVASAALAFTAIAMNLGVFISSPYMQLVVTALGTTDYAVVYPVSAVLQIVLAIVVFTVLKRAKSAAPSQS